MALALLALAFARTASSQATTFDIATFTPPAGWQRADQNGLVQLRSQHTVNGRMTSCQILLFPSRPGTPDAAQNFAAEWARLIAQPFGVAGLPRTESKENPGGWTAVTGGANVVQRGIPVTAILFTVTGHDRMMSVVISESGPEFTPEVQRFFGTLSFQASAGDQAAASPPGAAQTAQPTPAAPGASGGVSVPGNYSYAIPQGWTGTSYPDGGIVYGSQLYNNGERCQISVFPLRAASGDLAADARTMYAQIFQIDPFQNNEYPYPAASLTRGISAEGWSYFIIQKSIHGRAGDYGTLLGTRLMAVGLGDRVATITSTGKDPEVSVCFGAIVHDEWPTFFYSVHFKSWTVIPQEREVPRRLAGSWITATASVADRYVFAANGRFASAAAVMTDARISETELLQTTNAYFGDGSWTVSGSTLTLTRDNNRDQPARGRFRVEQVSTDGGVTWSDRLCLLLEGINGEVCYTRDQAP
ncbi:MAG TPA: hypothetical protein VIW26_03230 [Gemmatimonadales bacterium]